MSRTGGFFVAGVAILICAATPSCLLPHPGLQNERDQAALSRYSAIFQPGANRAAVEDYFRMNKISFRQLCCVDGETEAFADLIQVAYIREGWPVCSGTHNVAFVFSRTGPNAKLLPADPADVLKTVKLFELADNCF